MSITGTFYRAVSAPADGKAGEPGEWSEELAVALKHLPGQHQQKKHGRTALGVESTDLDSAVGAWSEEHSAEVRFAATALLSGQRSGGYDAEAATLLRGVSQGKHHNELHRGMEVEFSPDKTLEIYHPGAEIDISLTSASKSRSVAENFTDSEELVGTPILVTFRGAHGLDISSKSVFSNEKEVLIGGRFQVLSAAYREGVVHVDMEQIAVHEVD